MLPKLKQQDETSGLKDVHSITLQTAVRHLVDSYDRYLSKQNEALRFKSKKNPSQRYTTKMTNDNIKIIANRIQLPKLGLVKFAKTKEITGKIISTTFRKSPTGKYYIAILAEMEIQAFAKTAKSIGTDVGLQAFVILSDGTSYANPQFFRKLEAKLAREQRILACKKRRHQSTKLPNSRSEQLPKSVHKRRKDL